MSDSSFANTRNSDGADPESSAVEEAAREALEVMHRYGDLDPNDTTSDNNPWRHPDQVFAELDAARTKLSKAWESLESKMKQEVTEQAVQHRDEDFRLAYTNMVTDAFADVLEDMRNKTENIDLDILVDCLQSGIDLMSQDQKELLMEELDYDSDEEVDSGLSPHDLRRQQLGYKIETAV